MPRRFQRVAASRRGKRSKLAPPLLPSISEDSKFCLKDLGISETDSDKAIDREDHLSKLANALGRVFRENEIRGQHESWVHM